MPIWLTALIPLFSNIINLIPNAAEKAQAQLQMQQAINQAAAAQEAAQAQMLDSMSKTWVADSQSQSWMARNWRPMFMFLFMILIFNQYFINPVLIACGVPLIIPALPSQAWDAVLTGLGVCAIGRSAEKVATTYSNSIFNKEVFYADLKKSIYKRGLSQETVDALEAAINDAKQTK